MCIGRAGEQMTLIKMLQLELYKTKAGIAITTGDSSNIETWEKDIIVDCLVDIDLLDVPIQSIRFSITTSEISEEEE